MAVPVRGAIRTSILGVSAESWPRRSEGGRSPAKVGRSAYAIRGVDCAPLFPARDSVIPKSPVGMPTLQGMVSPDNAANALRLRDGSPIMDRAHADDELDADAQQP